MSNQLEIAARIRDLREALNLRQRETAEYLGLSTSKYQRLESNGRFNYEQIILLAELFNVTPNYIISGTDQTVSIMTANDDKTNITRFMDNTTLVQDNAENNSLTADLMNLWSQMSPDEKSTFIAFVKKQMEKQ